MFVLPHAGVCERELEDLRSPNLSLVLVFAIFFFLSRLPEPRAEPMDQRDFDDNNSRPSMDHAP